MMEEWQRRLVEERDQLRSRTNKLGAFLEGPLFPTLSYTHRGLLCVQHSAMQAYLDVLCMRIDLDGIEVP